MIPPSLQFAVKICGLSTQATLDAALEAGADMIGLNFHPRSPRLVTPEVARALADRARGRAGIMALLVDPDVAQARAIADAVRPDWLQLHGSETPGHVAALKAATGLKAMKAVGVSGPEDIAAARAHLDVADLVLLDAKPPKDASYPGGHGRPFDWSLLAGLDPAFPFVLSGGLDATNVAEAVAIARPAGVDVSSGVETAPGVKDEALIRGFVAAARNAALRHQQGSTR